MDMMLQVSGIALVSVVFSGVLRKNTPELALLLSLMAGIGIIMLLSGGMSEVLASITHLAELSQMDRALLVPVVKTVAISVVTKLTCELCKSGGEGGVASFVEYAGTVLALLVAVPLVEGVMTMMVEML